MGRSKSEPQFPLPHDRRAAGTSRRAFMGRIVGGVAIAVPAFRVLASPMSASAGTINAGTAPAKPYGPCAKTHDVYNGHTCGAMSPLEGCPQGYVAYCIGHYTIYSSTVTGYVCGTFTDNEGPCG